MKHLSLVSAKAGALLKRGIYETWYGNSAYVSGPTAKTAWDLDAGERIPVSELNAEKFIRPAKGRHD